MPTGLILEYKKPPTANLTAICNRDEEKNPHDNAAMSEAKAKIDYKILQKPERHQAVINNKLNGKTYKTIAQEVDIPYNKARKIFNNFTKELESECFDE